MAAIVADVTSWGQGQRGPAGVEYPIYAAWLAEMKADHWEIMTTDSDVADYGTSDFKGRPLDTAFARVKIRLKNAILGEYRDACFVFGRIVDPGFNMTREPFVAGPFVSTPPSVPRCGGEDTERLWQTGHGFQSRWIVGEQPTASPPSAHPILESSSPLPRPPTPGGMTKSEAGSTAGEPPLPIENLPQNKSAHEVEHGSADLRYLTVVYGMIKSHLRETPDLQLESANERGVVDFYVDEGGNLVGRKLISSSGSPNLDVAVMTAIAAAAPYPAPPNWKPIYLTYNFGKRPN